jgi:hypothetical protein
MGGTATCRGTACDFSCSGGKKCDEGCISSDQCCKKDNCKKGCLGGQCIINVEGLWHGCGAGSGITILVSQDTTGVLSFQYMNPDAKEAAHFTDAKTIFDPSGQTSTSVTPTVIHWRVDALPGADSIWVKNPSDCN